jgi:hypothetical protein
MRRALERLVFIDETSLKTNMVKTTGWAPVGDRLVDHAPFGHWRACSTVIRPPIPRTSDRAFHEHPTTRSSSIRPG